MPRKIASQESPDAIALLIEDHRDALDIFSQFEKLKSQREQDQDAKQLLVERACTAISIHSQIEEELFYPALRETFDDAELIDEAEVEHAACTQLITDLEAMHPEDEFYDAKFLVLGEYLRHHVAEEQEKIFPKAKKTRLNLSLLGEEMRQRREELYSEFAIPDEEDQIALGEVKPRRKGLPIRGPEL
jgi:hemerythrin-like domain-containing protein